MSCLREAERGASADEDCRNALVGDWRREVDPQFIRALVRVACDRQQNFLGGALAGVGTSSDIGGTGSVMEEQILRALKCDDQKGAFNESSLSAAVTVALRDRMDSRMRAVYAHVVVAHGPDKADCLREIRRSASAIQVTSLAAELIQGGGAAAENCRVGVGLDDEIPMKP